MVGYEKKLTKNKIDITNKILFYFISISFYSHTIIAAAENDKVKVDSLINIPYDVIVSEPNKAILLFQEGIKIAKQNGYKFEKAKLYSKLALAYSSKSEFDLYRAMAIKAINLFEEMDNEIELTNEYGLLGYHLRKTNLKLSKQYMRLSIELGKKNNLNKILTTIYDNYGIVHEFSNELDSALFYYKKGLELKYKLADSLGIPYSLNHLAGIYGVLGNINKAFEYMAESDKYRAKEKSNYGRAENAVISGELHAIAGDYDLAVKKFNESLELAKIMGNKHMAQYNYEKLSDIYQIKGDYKKALINLKNHKTYQDSILNKETNQKIAELEIKFESERKDKKIVIANYNIKKQKGQIFFYYIHFNNSINNFSWSLSISKI